MNAFFRFIVDLVLRLAAAITLLACTYLGRVQRRWR